MLNWVVVICVGKLIHYELHFSPPPLSSIVVMDFINPVFAMHETGVQREDLFFVGGGGKSMGIVKH